MAMMRRRMRSAAAKLQTAAYGVGIYHAVAPVLGGCGVIFSMHRVVKTGEPTLHPVYKIHADELDHILAAVEQHGWEFVRIDEIPARLADASISGRKIKPFAVFTSDDGYADNLTLALPIFRKHRAPICINIATAVIERSLFYWWGALEDLVFKRDRIDLPQIGESPPQTLWARNFEEKIRVYDALGAMAHTQGDAFFGVLSEILAVYGIDARRLLDRDALTLAQARELAADPLVTIGAHTLSHSRLSRMIEAEARYEIAQGRRVLEDWLGVEVRHFAYPFGRADACGAREFALAREAGYKTAVTTRQGNIFPKHSDYLECLPRRSIPVNRFKLRNVLSGLETLIRREPRFQTA